MTSVEELKLIARVVSVDDRRAFARLVDMHSAGVFAFLLKLCQGDASLAEDLSQDTFVKAYSGIGSFRATARFRTWLFSIAYHEFLSYKRATRNAVTCVDVTEAYEIRSQQSVPCVINDIDGAIARLGDTERTIVTLFYLNDMSIKDVSRVTGIKSGTVKSHLSRARVKLAQMLKEYKEI